MSTQAVYDVLNTLTARGLVRRIQPAGSTARYELRVGDNHHHLVCRGCGSVVDVDCVSESAPCLEASDLDRQAPGFVVDEAEVTFWGFATPAPEARPAPDHTPTPTSTRPTGGEHDRHRGIDPNGGSHDGHRRTRAQRPQLASRSAPTGRSCCTTIHFMNQMAHFNRERVPERNVHAKGSRRVRRLRDHRGRVGVHQGRAVPAGREDRDARPLLHRRRRAGLPRHLARPARLRAEVLHDRGQLRPGRQQHPGLLHPRHDEVPALHPLAEAARRLRPARQQHAVGLLDASTRSRPTRSPT